MNASDAAIIGFWAIGAISPVTAIGFYFLTKLA